MDCDLTAGLATSVVDDGTSTKGKSIGFNASTALADASYDHTSDHLYTDIEGSTNFEDLGVWASSTTPATNWDYGEVGTESPIHYYYAATWTMTFKYTFVAEKTNINLFFNVRQATAQITAGTNTSVTDTAQGFRLAFVTGSAGSPANGVVWAPFATQGTWNDDGDDGTTPVVDKIRYVHAATATPPATPYGAYTHDTANEQGDLLDSSDINGSRYNHAATATPATTATNYIGTFAKPADPGLVSLTVRCTAWFEGTDPLITTRAETDLQAVKIKLPFYVRNAAA
ncbi:MAG: hypothetical protein IJ787_00670 [Bacilli bacterium]|nr:hypothetical protein [Bacilli bacterium]